MDEQGKAPGGADLKPVFNALVLLLLTGIFVQQLPLGGGRPLPDKERRPAAGIKLDARLWTDPFEAPRQDLKDGARHATNFGDIGGQMAARILRQEQTPKVVVLPVMVEGGPYFENIEGRRRTRYAVVSGLSAAGYEPEDAESIQYLHYPDPFQLHDPLEQIELSAADRQFPDVLPYEWFQPASATSNAAPVPRVLVLWLEEGRFAGRPLEKLGVLYSQLRYYAMRSVYRVSSPERPIGDYAGCAGPEHRPSLLQEELAKLFVQVGLTDPAARKSPERLWEELKSLLGDDAPAAAVGLDRYLRLLPLARWLRPDAPGASATEAVLKELQALAPDVRDETQNAAPAPREAKGGERFTVNCDVPYNSFLFQLLRHRTTDFLNALGERLLQAASGGESEFFLMPGIRTANPQPVFAAASYDFRILGPASSGLLKAMLAELKDLPDNAGEDGLNRFYPFRFFSPGASAEESGLLALAGGGGCPPSGTAAQCFAQKGLSFVRTIATDDRLAERIGQELQLRDVPIGSAQHPIVLISEWDRIYTQQLRKEFCRALDGEKKQRDQSEVGHCAVLPGGSGPVVFYSYLRGLDGEGAQKFKPSDDRDRRNGAPAKPSDAAKLFLAGGQSFPWGDDGVDYLQRMAGDLKAYEARLRARDGMGSIRAIGLLGSDVYDKLLILRALKPQFPEALFFTTDLDARLLNGTVDDGMTQNLMVASSWGLRLHSHWQRDIPPFRSVYQTSYFLATQFAMKPLEWQRDCAARLHLEPKIFEVGRTRFVELPPPGGPATGGQSIRADCGPGSAPAVLDIATPPPWPLQRLSGAVWAGVLVAALVIGCMIRAACCRVGQAGKAQPGRDPGATRGDLVLFGVAAAGALSLGYLFVRSEEPFALSEGISIWPTELIRGVAFLLTMFYFWPQCLCWMQPLRAELERSELLVAGSSDWNMKGVRHYVHNTRFWGAIALLAGAVAAVQVGAQHDTPFGYLFLVPLLLAAYAIPLSLRTRLWTPSWTEARTTESLIADLYRHSVHENRDQRIRGFMVAFLAASLALMLAFGLPLAPFRGAHALLADRLVLDAAIIAYLGLLAVVIETTRSVRAYLLQLADTGASDSIETFAGHWGMEPSLAMHWLKVRWVGIVTKHVSRLIVYPFVIAATLALARNRLFDNWSVPLGLVLVFALSFGFLAFCSWSLKKTAGDVRDRALAELRVLATRAQHAGQNAEVAKVNDVAGKVEAYREGSYASILQRPMFKGVLLLVGGGSADFLMPMLFNLF